MFKIEFRSKEGKLIRKKIYETREAFDVWRPKHEKRSWCRLTYFKYVNGTWQPLKLSKLKGPCGRQLMTGQRWRSKAGMFEYVITDFRDGKLYGTIVDGMCPEVGERSHEEQELQLDIHIHTFVGGPE